MASRMRRLIDYFGLAEPASESRTVGEILADCQALYLPVAELKGVSLLVDARGAEALRIEADLSRLVLTTLLSLAVRSATAGQKVVLDATAQGPNAVAFELEMPDLAMPAHFERFEPPEHAGQYDAGTLETFWTCLGLARRIGGSISIVKATSGRSATVRFECVHE